LIAWDAKRVAAATGARLLRASASNRDAGDAREADARRGGAEAPDEVGRDTQPGPRRVTIDSREVLPGDLFVGLHGERVDGGAYAARALAAGAWGVLVATSHAEALRGEHGADFPPGMLLAHPDPLGGLQALARAWRAELGATGARVVAVTGSTGKTSTKDILAALLRQDRSELARSTVCSPENLNTEIGLPLAVLAAPAGTEALVLELAMRGAGQIAQLTAIAEPDVGVIVNVGPVHLEQLGSLKAVAAAKSELIAGMAPATTVVIPAGEPLLAPHRRADLRTITFGEGGDVELLARGPGGEVTIADRTRPDGVVQVPMARQLDDGTGGPAEGVRPITLRPSFAQSHNLRNLLAAVAAARALGITPEGSLEVRFSALRGEHIALGDGIVLINDCYNANPMSMRAALDDLADTAPARRVAVLGDMLELGPGAQELHRELAAHARDRGVGLLVAVGPLAARTAAAFEGEAHSVPDADTAAGLLEGMLRADDMVLVKGSRGVGLEQVAQRLANAIGARSAPGPDGRSAQQGPATGR
jgi:UDP-N-acetylmuramoyl-tripeptide--D-alanyl-D-alanine ligase